MPPHPRLLAAACAALIASTGATPAATPGAAPEAVGAFGRWTVAVRRDGPEPVCYMIAAPLRSEGRYARRGETHFFVTLRSGGSPGGEVSALAGYPHRPGQDVAVTIDGRRFRLFTEGDAAWARTAAEDRRLVDALRAGRKMVVQGTSSRGTRTTDTYDLAGSAAAYARMREACG